ncbi:AAA family ATPase [bacterium]|nr:AAA family ATPase [FCB group bacterium]MBL7190834.1 AAA family ATPase [bacterium]
MSIPKIEALTVKNYRALKHLQLKNITPLTVILGPNGSGKSTLFDVFAFLSECFSVGLRKAWDKRGRMKELRTRNSEGPIEIVIRFREHKKDELIVYKIAIDEYQNVPFIARESLRWKQSSHKKPFIYLNFKKGKGYVVSDIESSERINETLDSTDMLAVNTLGQFKKHPIVAALRRFITNWYLSDISIEDTRIVSNAGIQEHLSVSGDNLPNVIQYFEKEHSSILSEIFNFLSEKIPGFEKFILEPMIDGRLHLQLKDRSFKEPILAKYTSDGTLKLLALMTILKNPKPAQLTGIEEPENQVHPRLLYELGEEFREASANTQLFVSTHSPYFANTIRPKELWIFDRNEQGYTIAKRAFDISGVKEMYESGGNLGFLWMENYFEFGDPIKSSKISYKMFEE